MDDFDVLLPLAIFFMVFASLLISLIAERRFHAQTRRHLARSNEQFQDAMKSIEDWKEIANNWESNYKLMKEAADRWHGTSDRFEAVANDVLAMAGATQPQTESTKEKL